MEQEIFFVRLTENGAAHLYKFYRLVKVLFPLSILTSAIIIVDEAIRFWNPLFSPGKISDSAIRTQVYVSIAYTVIFCFLAPYQAYSYYQFAMRNKKGVDEHSVEGFNNSFRWLFINAIASLVGFVINFIYVSFIVYTHLILSKKI